ncbi:phage tailspike protein, partial [Escherichia coli]|uniref:phage tailspike protein n=1 Tax=Escherichia coli TaxID=562 RepID=UPI001BFCD205
MSDITANLVVGMPSQLFTLARSFKANANGKVYLGIPDTDPIIPANQIPVYIESETGDLIPTAQPIVINAGGYPVYNGQISKFVTVQNYSMTVYDAYGSQQFYFPDIAKYDPDQLRQQLESSSGADIVMTGSAPFIVRSVGDILKDIPTNKYFGAKCDGVTDDTVANQTALDWSADNKRTVLFVGKSCTSSRLVLKSGARMENIGSIAPKNFTDTVVIEIKDDAWRSPYNDGITAIQTGNRVLLNNINIDPDEVINAVGIYGTDGAGPVINNARIFNMRNGGINIEKGYEWKFNNTSVVAPEDQLGTSGVSGILHRTSDSMYINTTVVGYPVGMEVTSGANDIVNTHVWGLDGIRTTRVMLIGLKLGGSSNNVINYYSDTPHKLDKTQPASIANGGIGYVISGFNNNLVCPRVLFHVNDGPKYGKVFYISGTENSIREPVSSDVSGIEDGGVYVFSGSATPINNNVSGGNLQSFYVFPQSTGFNPTINAPCTYTSQIYRHELTQRSVSGRLTIECNITSNVGSGAFSISLPPYLSSFKGDCTGSIFTILNNTIRADTNLIEVRGYITG